MMVNPTDCSTQNRRIKDTRVLTADRAEDTDDGEEDDTDHISLEECDNLGGEKGCSGFGIGDARAYLAQ